LSVQLRLFAPILPFAMFVLRHALSI